MKRLLLDTSALLDKNLLSQLKNSQYELYTTKLNLYEIKKGCKRGRNTNFFSYNPTNSDLFLGIKIIDEIEVLENYWNSERLLKDIKEWHYKVRGEVPQLSFTDEAILMFALCNNHELVTKDKVLRDCYQIGEVVLKYQQKKNWNKKSKEKKILKELKRKLQI